jgi:hypothetical protein
MESFDERRLQVMMEEWRLSENSIRELGTTIFKIRTWVVTLIIGGTIAAIRFNSLYILFLMPPFLLVFYLVDNLVGRYRIIFLKSVRVISQNIQFILQESDVNREVIGEFYTKPIYPDNFDNKLYMKHFKENFFDFEKNIFYFPLLAINFLILFIVVYFNFSSCAV